MVIEHLFDAGSRRIDGKQKFCRLLFRFDGDTGKLIAITRDVPQDYHGPCQKVPYAVYRYLLSLLPRRVPYTAEQKRKAQYEASKRWRTNRKAGIRIRPGRVAA